MVWKKIFSSQAKNITLAASLLSASAVVSRILGLVKEALIAGYFGRSAQADVYFASFRIPDLIYNFFIVGGLSVVFLPLFSNYYQKNKSEAWKVTNYILNDFFIIEVIASIILFIFTPQLVKIIAPGFSVSQVYSAIRLTRLLFLSPILFGLANIFSGILMYFNNFLVYAIAPVLYNLGIIFGILFLSPRYGIFGVGWGVIIGALGYLLVQIPLAKIHGFHYKPIFSLHHPAIRKIVYLMIPRSFSILAQQINLIIITALASLISTGSIAIFTYANDIQHLPVNLVGVPFALAAFPFLSKHWSDNNRDKFSSHLSSSFRQIFFVVFPSSILIFILRAQIVRLIFGTLGPGHRFDWVATRLTSASLALFSLGIFAYALVPLLSRAFFSFQDTKTPAIISVLSCGFNIILSFYFVKILSFSNFFSQSLIKVLKLGGMPNVQVIGLPLAFSFSVIFQFILLFIVLYRRMGNSKLTGIYSSGKKTVLASFIAVPFTYGGLYLADVFFNTHTVLGLLEQTVLAGSLGVAIYLIFAWFLKAPELRIVSSVLLKKFFKNGSKH